METALLTTGIIVFGLLSGLLVNYLADILPVTRQVFGPPRCSHCYEEHSILSYLTFRRCNSCLKFRSARTWIVLVAFPLAFLWVWQTFERMPFWASAVLIIYLALIAIIDLEHRVVLHPTSIFGAVICFLAGWYLHDSIVYTLLGGIAGFAIMLGLYYLGLLLQSGWQKFERKKLTKSPWVLAMSICRAY
jgi:prepilin signal peptidase PulO-like enzyme (type II secretory pathway)